MKYVYLSFTVLTILSILVFTGCKKDEASTPVSFVDGYSVTLTEASGTAYSGDFFPIVAGYTCSYSGHANLHTATNIPGENPTSDSVDAPATGYLHVLPSRHIVLQSGTYQLYPVVDAATIEQSFSADTSRFFMKDTQAVYVKAIKLSDGSYLEVTDPLFLKSRLVVGDSWETAPQMNMAQLMSSQLDSMGVQSDLTLTARAKFFVAGMETVSLPIGIRRAVRMEQANDVSLTGTMSITQPGYGTVVVNVNMTAQLAVVYHMIADTGIVHQNTTGPLNMSLSAQGQTATISMRYDECDLRLTGLSINPSIVEQPSITAKQSPSFHTQLQHKLWKISQAIANVVTRKLIIQ